MITFDIFKKKKGIYWTNTLIVYSIAIPCLLVEFIKYIILDFEQKKNIFDDILFYIALGSLGYGLVMGVSGFVRHQPLKGKLEGSLILEDDKITIDHEAYRLDEIKKIKILNYDYYSKFNFPTRGSFEASLSRGVDNKFEIILNSGEIVSCAFCQFNRYDIVDAKKQLINYHLKGKIEFLHLIEILGISGFNQIKLFKKEIKWFQEDR
ncbi:hypothetical protein NU10_10875 [Flavobacterium dauae]|uniref:hypothetical protein n=1 Tax=Flavobacterium dauae TaxID=1563479 RepID=UPI00101B2B5F|nr:hypothetical protein [Flavobacterium dauae]WLD23207.1 hypothetical protein NU10_10875 [Flavobacterium dauae]